MLAEIDNQNEDKVTPDGYLQTKLMICAYPKQDNSVASC